MVAFICLIGSKYCGLATISFEAVVVLAALLLLTCRRGLTELLVPTMADNTVNSSATETAPEISLDSPYRRILLENLEHNRKRTLRLGLGFGIRAQLL